MGKAWNKTSRTVKKEAEVQHGFKDQYSFGGGGDFFSGDDVGYFGGGVGMAKPITWTKNRKEQADRILAVVDDL